MKKSKNAAFFNFLSVEQIAPYLCLLLPILLLRSALGDFFIHEDMRLLYDGSRILEGSRSVFSPILGTFRPFYLAYFAVMFEWFGTNPVPYHLASAFLYGINAVLFIRLLNHWDFDSRVAALSGILLSSIGRSIEVAYYISSIDHLFVTFFALSAGIWFANVRRGVGSKRMFWASLCALSLGCGLFSKITGALAFGLLFFYEIHLRWRSRHLRTVVLWGGYILLGLFVTAGIMMRLLGQPTETSAFSFYHHYAASFFQNPFQRFFGVLGNLGDILLPPGFALFLHKFGLRVITSLLILLGLAGIGWLRLPKKNRAPIVLGLLTATILLSAPLLFLKYAGLFLGSRLLYLPFFPLSCLIAFAAVGVLDYSPRKLRIVVLCSFLLFWGGVQGLTAQHEIEKQRVRYLPTFHEAFFNDLGRHRNLAAGIGGIIPLDFPGGTSIIMQHICASMVRLQWGGDLTCVSGRSYVEEGGQSRWISTQGRFDSTPRGVRVDANSQFLQEVITSAETQQLPPRLILWEPKRKIFLFGL